MVSPVTEAERGWYIQLNVNGRKKSFKIDTGASVTAVPYDSETATWTLNQTARQLKGVSGHRLLTVGTQECTLS